jgi:hypothetical protein
VDDQLLARSADPIAVTVVLVRIRDVRAVIGGVRDAVPVDVRDNYGGGCPCGVRKLGDLGCRERSVVHLDLVDSAREVPALTVGRIAGESVDAERAGLSCVPDTARRLRPGAQFLSVDIQVNLPLVVHAGHHVPRVVPDTLRASAR